MGVQPGQLYRTLTQKGLAVGLVLYCNCLKIPILFEQGAPRFHLHWASTKYIASPDKETIQVTDILIITQSTNDSSSEWSKT